MKTEFEIECMFPVSAGTIYKAWLSSEGHSQMTGGEAQCSEVEGDAFSAWDGYISGTNIKLVPDQEIVQNWRTTEFAEEDEDSLLTIQLEPTKEGCRLKLKHERIPEGQSDYEQGWHDHYFTPMSEYFTDQQ